MLKNIFTKLENEKNICLCQTCFYLHRIYLNIEKIIEHHFKKNGKRIDKSGSYHKELLNNYFDSIGLNDSNAYLLVDELRGFRHVFNNRADILEFNEDKIFDLTAKVLDIENEILTLFEVQDA